jgi:hypothetical protein
LKFNGFALGKILKIYYSNFKYHAIFYNELFDNFFFEGVPFATKELFSRKLHDKN